MSKEGGNVPKLVRRKNRWVLRRLAGASEKPSSLLSSSVAKGCFCVLPKGVSPRSST